MVFPNLIQRERQTLTMVCLNFKLCNDQTAAKTDNCTVTQSQNNTKTRIVP